MKRAFSILLTSLLFSYTSFASTDLNDEDVISLPQSLRQEAKAFASVVDSLQPVTNPSEQRFRDLCQTIRLWYGIGVKKDEDRVKQVIRTGQIQDNGIVPLVLKEVFTNHNIGAWPASYALDKSLQTALNDLSEELNSYGVLFQTLYRIDQALIATQPVQTKDIIILDKLATRDLLPASQFLERYYGTQGISGAKDYKRMVSRIFKPQEYLEAEFSAVASFSTSDVLNAYHLITISAGHTERMEGYYERILEEFVSSFALVIRSKPSKLEIALKGLGGLLIMGTSGYQAYEDFVLGRGVKGGLDIGAAAVGLGTVVSAGRDIWRLTKRARALSSLSAAKVNPQLSLIAIYMTLRDAGEISASPLNILVDKARHRAEKVMKHLDGMTNIQLSLSQSILGFLQSKKDH